MLALGVAVSAWILTFTDVFEEFAGLLALSGLFSWIAFVSKLLPEDRVKALQGWTDREIFCRNRTTWAIFCGFGVALLVFSLLGSVQVESYDTIDRAMHVGRAGGKADLEGEVSRLLPGKRLREVFITSWFRQTNVRIKAIGYPDVVKPLKPWTVTKLYLPASFLRPVVLVIPSPKLMAFPDSTIQLLIDDKEWDKIPFDGKAVWVGCDRQVEIPKSEGDALRSFMTALSDAEKPQALDSWFHPDAASDKQLPAGSTIKVQFVLSNGSVEGEATDLLRLPVSSQDFPQRIYLAEKQ